MLVRSRFCMLFLFIFAACGPGSGTPTEDTGGNFDTNRPDTSGCDDLDGDGYCEPDDCNDGDRTVNPARPEVCGNTKDDDCNGDTDGDDSACSDPGSAQSLFTFRAGSWVEADFASAFAGQANAPTTDVDAMFTTCGTAAEPNWLCFATATDLHCVQYDGAGVLNNTTWIKTDYSAFTDVDGDYQPPTFGVVTGSDFTCYPNRILSSQNDQWWAFDYTTTPDNDWGLTLHEAHTTLPRQDHDTEWMAADSSEMPPGLAANVTADWVEIVSGKARWFVLSADGSVNQFTFEESGGSCSGAWSAVTDNRIQMLNTLKAGIYTKIGGAAYDCNGALRVVAKAP